MTSNNYVINNVRPLDWAYMMDQFAKKSANNPDVRIYVLKNNACSVAHLQVCPKQEADPSIWKKLSIEQIISITEQALPSYHIFQPLLNIAEGLAYLQNKIGHQFLAITVCYEYVNDLLQQIGTQSLPYQPPVIPTCWLLPTQKHPDA